MKLSSPQIIVLATIGGSAVGYIFMGIVWLVM